MWMLNPKLLCRKHLLGAHCELHKFRPSFVKHHSIDGRLTPVVQIEPASMKRRHDELAAEMVRRGYNHKSPYEQPDLSYLPKEQREAKVDRIHSLADLCGRCPDCRERIRNAFEGISKNLEIL
jgi:7-cyano-7-deazaguanine synthase in queuosine biosynthesis